MERNIAKQVFTKDRKKRITVYYDEDGINPMESTDFPLHCEDWVRGYTIATGKHSSNYESSARGLLEWVLDNHADSEKAIDYLIKAGKDEKHFGLDDYLIYNRSERRWELWSDGYDEEWFDKRDYIDWLAITGRLTDETIDFMVSEFLRDTIKMCEYGFDYYSGGVTFYGDTPTCDSNGIAYIEKDEFLKWGGNPESYWTERKSIRDICGGFFEEIENWSEGNCFYYETEEWVTYKETREFINSDRETEERITGEWEEIDSCGGFYDENYVIEYAAANLGMKKEDFQ